MKHFVNNIFLKCVDYRSYRSSENIVFIRSKVNNTLFVSRFDAGSNAKYLVSINNCIDSINDSVNALRILTLAQ